MMNPSNLCIFEGRVSRDPQISQVQMGLDQNGQPNMVDKALFSIAVDRALSTQQRNKVKGGDTSIKTADFIPCSLLGAQVATLRQYFPKGKAIRVIGHYTEYQTTDQQTGQTKYGHMFEIDNISFTIADAKNLQNNNQQAPQQNNYQQPQNNYQQPQNNYQQPQGYQQAPPQNYQQAPAQNNNFAMFDESASPF